MDGQTAGLALSLVHAWLAAHPEYYCTQVAAHKQYRWSPSAGAYRFTLMDAHWRRKQGWGNVEGALACTCAGFQALGEKPRKKLLVTQYMMPARYVIRMLHRGRL